MTSLGKEKKKDRFWGKVESQTEIVNEKYESFDGRK